MATSQGTFAISQNPDAGPHLQQIRDQFGITGQLAVIPTDPEYAVSDCGRVFAWSVTTRHRRGQLRELAQTINPNGYRYVRITRSKTSRPNTVHRLVALMFLPPPSPGQGIVRHLDGNQTNNRVSNLAWGTYAENMADCIRHGRTLRGTRNTNAKLTDNVIRAVRLLAADGFSPPALAAFFGVDANTVQRVITGEHWGHVDA